MISTPLFRAWQCQKHRDRQTETQLCQNRHQPAPGIADIAQRTLSQTKMNGSGALRSASTDKTIQFFVNGLARDKLITC
jgi:hypothetical protein